MKDAMESFSRCRPIIKQFSCFAAMGAVGTMAHYSVLVACVQIMSADPIAASVAGFITGALVNYALNYRITFHSSQRHRKAMVKFFSVALTGLGLNTIIMALLTRGLEQHYLMSQVVATAFVLIWNFLGNRLWTFKEFTDAKPR